MAGKSPDDLVFKDDRPQTPTARAKPEWRLFVEEIEDLLATGKYDWASETLEGIQETVEQREQVTEGQRRAVRNIEASAHRERASRRYEGHSRRGR